MSEQRTAVDGRFDCAKCGHWHTGPHWGSICIACPCPEKPKPTSPSTPSPAWEQYRQTAWDLFEMAEYGKTGNTFADFRANRIDAMLKAIWDAARAAAASQIEAKDAEIERHRLIVADLVSQREVARRETDDLRAQVAALSAQVEQLEKDYDAARTELREWTLVRVALEADNQQLLKQVEQLTQEKDMQAATPPYPSSDKGLKEMFPGVSIPLLRGIQEAAFRAGRADALRGLGRSERRRK